MKLILSNFLHLINRFTNSTILNILGLSAAFSVFIIITIQLNYNYTFNRSFENADNIYTFKRYFPKDDLSAWSTSVPLAEKISADFSEIKNYCLLQVQGTRSFDIHREGNVSSVGIANLIVGTTGFKEIFRPEIIQGSASEVFEQNDKVMISEKTARSLFGSQDPIGKVIYEHYSQTPYNVVAIYKDFPENSSLTNGVYVKLTSYKDNNWGYESFFEIIPGSYDNLVEKLNGAEFRGEETLKQQIDPSIREEYDLISFADIYMMKRQGVKTVSLSLLMIAVFILIIAYTNFFNFSIAIAPVRVKNFNIRGILGSNKSSLILVIISEGVFITSIAFILALLFIHFFSTTSLTNFFVADLSLTANLYLILVTLIIFIALSVIVSIYPARYITSVKESIILNGSFAFSSRGSKLRNILITFQYITAIILISVSVSVFIKLQQEYMKNHYIGFEKENIVYFPIEGLKTDLKTFGEEMTANPLITDYTASGFVPGHIHMSWGRHFEGKHILNLYAWPVTHNFLDFFNIKLIAGQNFTKQDTVGLEQMVLNEKFLEKYEFDEGIIGKEFPMFNAGVIMGIVPDVNFASLHSAIDPMAFVIVNDQKTWMTHAFFKVSGTDMPQTIEYMKNTWGKFSDDDFNLSFLDTTINELYKQEENQSQLIGIFGLITVVITMMGVYGLIVFNIRYKEKEIGLRKVNGATELQIVFLLNKSMLVLFLIAFIIAVPIAYYLIMKWLDNFAYKVSASWWVFGVAGLLVLIISFITVSWQSWKAAVANPVDSLKTE